MKYYSLYVIIYGEVKWAMRTTSVLGRINLMKYYRIYSLENGETRSEFLPYDLKTNDFIKGTPSFQMADMGLAKTLKVASPPVVGLAACIPLL